MTSVYDRISETGEQVINGQTYKVFQIETRCKTCDSTNVAPEGNQKHLSGWTCWNCEVSFDKSNKTENKRNQKRNKASEVLSLNERAETVSQEYDDQLISFYDNLSMVELDVYLSQCGLTGKQEMYLRGYIQHGSYQAVADQYNVSRKAVEKSLKNISLDKTTVKKDLF